MEITRLSDKGQITIPQALRDVNGWKDGQELIVINLGDGILLKPNHKQFPETKLNDVAGCLKYQENSKSLKDIDDAIRQGVEELWHGGS